MDIRQTAQAVARRHGTNDPYRIAEEQGYIVLLMPLIGMRGSRLRLKRRNFIFINSELDEYQQRLVCAHELGHFLLHKGDNRFFMDRCTNMVVEKYEIEAHKFSVDLLYADDELQDMLEWPIEHVARFMGVPVWLAEYRMRSVEPKFLI